MRDHEQYLVYEMSVSLEAPVAMVLPLPVVPGSGERAVRFINMEPYPRFFSRLRELFPAPKPVEFEGGMPVLALAGPQILEVHDVGAFEASFVPSIRDFDRLDPRFRLADRIWRHLPDYGDFGFAVFQLRAGAQRVHPMALAFPTRDRESIFYPTVHVHDSDVHPKAYFDHTLYCQEVVAASIPQWEKAANRPSTLEWFEPEDRDVDLAGSSRAPLPIDPPEVLDGARSCFRREILGLIKNEDNVLPLTPAQDAA